MDRVFSGSYLSSVQEDGGHPSAHDQISGDRVHEALVSGSWGCGNDRLFGFEFKFVVSTAFEELQVDLSMEEV